jgi:hypothetical protein
MLQRIRPGDAPIWSTDHFTEFAVVEPGALEQVEEKKLYLPLTRR